MSRGKGLLAPQNTFLDTIATRFNGTHSNFLLGSAQVPGTFPIVYCSDGFCELTGFARSQVMQQCCSCEFLYGRTTGEDDKSQIKDALHGKEELKTEITMYKKNGESFLCLLDIVPIKNGTNNVVMFLVSHKDITDYDSDNLRENADEEAPNSLFTGYSSSCEDSPEIPSFNTLNQRRRSRAVLYNLSENLEKKQKKGFFHVITNRMFGRRKNTLPEYKVATTLQSPFTILHYGTAKTIWDWFVVVVTIYVTAVVPYWAAVQSVPSKENSSSIFFHRHGEKHSRREATLIFDVLVEIVFIVDIVLTFLTTYVNKSGWVVSDFRHIAINYFRTWFLIDLVAALPVDTISHIFQVDFFSHPVPLLKTVRLLRLFRLLQKIGRWSQYSALVLAMLMVMFGLVAHWLACIWFTIGWQEFKEHPIGSETGIGWLYELSDVLRKPFSTNGTGGPDVTDSYITSLYFTLSSLTSVGFGNVSANTNTEKIFSICVMMIGALMHAVVFGNVTAIIQRLYARRQQYDIKIRDLKDFIKVHRAIVRRLSKPIKRRMIDHFQQTWEASGGVNPNEIMKDFPREIRADVAMHLHRELLSMPVFQRGNTGFRRYLALHTRRCKVSPGDHVIYEGDPLETVNVVCNGSLEVLQNDLVIGILGKGDIFGADVDTQNPLLLTSRADVKALTYCELECISVDAIFNVTYLYPHFSQIFINDIKSDYSCNLWEQGPHARNTTSTCNGDVPGNFAKPSPTKQKDSDSVFEPKPQCNGKNVDETLQDSFETIPLIDHVPSKPKTPSPTRENGIPVNNGDTLWSEVSQDEATPLDADLNSSQTDIVITVDDCNGVANDDIEATVVTTTGLEPATYYYSTEETAGRKRKGIRALLKSLSISLNDKSTPSKNKRVELVTNPTISPLPPCIRKTPDPKLPSARLMRSVSDNLTTKRVKFVEDFAPKVARKSGSVAEDDLKRVSQQLRQLRGETFDIFESELCEKSSPHRSSDNLDVPDPREALPRNKNTETANAYTSGSPRRVSTSGESKSTSRRRRRPRRKSLSPKATEQIRRARAGVEEGEFLSDTSPQTRSVSSRKNRACSSDSSVSECESFSDSVFCPSCAPSGGGVSGGTGSQEDATPQCRHIVDAMQKLLIQVSTLNADVRRLFAQMNSDSATKHRKSYSNNKWKISGDCEATPLAADPSSSLETQFAPTFRPCRVSPDKSIVTPKIKQEFEGKSAPSPLGAPDCVVTSPSGELFKIDLNTRVKNIDTFLPNGTYADDKRENETTFSIQSPRSPIALGYQGGPFRCSPTHLFKPQTTDNSPRHGYFFPLGLDHTLGWNSCTDLEEEWPGKRLAVPFGGGGRGSESGYMSNSPTLQMGD